jgi:hypothetical protein
MKKLLLALLALPMSLFAADFDRIGVDVSGSNDQGVHFGIANSGSLSLGLAGEGYTFTFNQDGNAMTVSSYGVELSRSDSKKIGVGYGAGIGIFDGGVHYHWMSNGNHVVGGATTLTVGGVGLETSADWNLSASDITGKVGTSLDLWGAQASAVSNWDIDDLSYNGLELGAGYAIPVAAGIHITPSVGMDFDSEWARGDATASVAINLSFGSNGIQTLY